MEKTKLRVRRCPDSQLMDQSNYRRVNTEDYEGHGGVIIDQRNEELKMICPQRLMFMFLAQSNRNGYNMGGMEG